MLSKKLLKKGIKKLFSLTRTKIRLAEEVKTEDTGPAPPPLVKFFSGKEIKTVSEAKKYRDDLFQKINYKNPKELATIIFQLLDIIEGVKYKFEPKDCCFLLNENELKRIEKRAEKENLKVNILFMTKKSYPGGINLFIGENTPKDAILISKVPSSITTFLNFAFHSKYFFKDERFRGINSILGHKTLILYVIHFALGEFGATLKEEGGGEI
jgi:hypothetical protein